MSVLGWGQTKLIKNIRVLGFLCTSSPKGEHLTVAPLL